ncbi:CLUMA_CG002190, isoform A [Clunio marinus]|uniref:CLUMA_CG002190, isoform A n=1 Tax=Clunio marinus TaxID=568069 RepID=A0A1J1HK49_9DIPT|nr:CLUMA_CG002190, isoform A [Clunio marinus]
MRGSKRSWFKVYRINSYRQHTLHLDNQYQHNRSNNQSFPNSKCKCHMVDLIPKELTTKEKFEKNLLTWCHLTFDMDAQSYFKNDC